MIKISGFTDEVSSTLSVQIALLKELCENYMCPRIINGKNIATYTPEEFSRDILPILKENGIGFSSIGSPIGKVELYDDKAFSAQLVQLKALIEIAKLTNCKYIRVFSFFVDEKGNYDGYFDQVVKKMRQMLDLVEGTDVILLHENEKHIYGDTPERCLKLYETINHPNLKLAFDSSNYIQCNCNPWEAYLMLREYTAYYHVKDCSPEKVEVPLGMGIGQYDAIIADLIERGYDGFMTLEPHVWKYALLKKASYLLYPIFKLIPLTRYFPKVFRRIDKQYKIAMFKGVSKKQVYVWQYNNLKKYLRS